MRQLLPSEYERFIETIGHSPITTISIHQLRQNLADVYLIGEPENFAAAIIQERQDKSEPLAFGNDAAATWEILQALEGWECVEVSLEIAPQLSQLMPENRPYQDIFYQLDSPVKPHPFPNTEIRFLNEDDALLMQSSSPHCQTHHFGSIEDSLKYGIVAGAIEHGRIVSLAHCCMADKFADIGVFTESDWRRRGYSAACTALVAEALQKRGLIPVWSTGEDNIASQRVALKLGFHEVTRMIYLIPTRAA
jgi:RimJ/RimL family protein N-acetyltransferase